MTTIKTYEVKIPVTEYWVFEVDATSPENAIEAGRTGQDEFGNQAYQTHTESCGNNAKPLVRLVTKTRGPS